MNKKQKLNLEFHPLTPDRWVDLEELFGSRGATGGCWCMYWRLSRYEFEQHKGEGNRAALKSLVYSGDVPGILAYLVDDDLNIPRKPVGWCSIAPRETFLVLNRSRILKPVDGQQVWSIVCFFIGKSYRRKGVSKALLQAAVNYAAMNGAKIVEGYPVEPRKNSSPDVFVYTGLAVAFQQVGFIEVARRSETRPIMRYFVENH